MQEEMEDSDSSLSENNEEFTKDVPRIKERQKTKVEPIVKIASDDDFDETLNKTESLPVWTKKNSEMSKLDEPPVLMKKTSDIKIDENRKLFKKPSEYLKPEDPLLDSPFELVFN